MPPEEARSDRRRFQRYRLGLPVNVHVAWRNDPVTVQMVDIGAEGVRFRSGSGALRLDQEAAFGFVIPGRHVCVANGRVLRVGGDGEFVLSVERANAAFHGFLVSLAA
jgi:PilZ domain